MKLPEVESRTQGSRPRPRAQKKIRGQGQPFRGQTLSREAKNRNTRGHGPRTQAQVLSKKKKKGLHKNLSGYLQKKKKVFTKIFQAISTKQRFPKNFSSAPQTFNNSKNSAVLEPRTWGLEAKDLTFEAKDFKMCPRGRPRGQGRPRRLHLWKLLHFRIHYFVSRISKI